MAQKNGRTFNEHFWSQGHQHYYDFRNLVPAYCNDKLTPSETRLLYTHLLRCERCRDRFDSQLSRFKRDSSPDDSVYLSS